MLEPILAEISDRNQLPRRRSLTLAAKQNTLYDFFFTRATNFSSKEKSILLGSAPNESGGGAGLYFFARSLQSEIFIGWTKNHKYIHEIKFVINFNHGK